MFGLVCVGEVRVVGGGLRPHDLIRRNEKKNAHISFNCVVPKNIIIIIIILIAIIP